MSLPPEEIARLKALLPQLRAAYDQMVMGQKPTEIRDQNGEFIRFSAPTDASRAALRNRIVEVEYQLGIPSSILKTARKVAIS